MERYMDIFNRCQPQLLKAAMGIAWKMHQLGMTDHSGYSVVWLPSENGFGEIYAWRAGSKNHAKKTRDYLVEKEIVPSDFRVKLKRNGFDDWSLIIHARDIDEDALDAEIASKKKPEESFVSRFSQNTP